MRFLGNIEAKADTKGRAFLPAVFRKVLQASGAENLVLRKDVFESCLVLYTECVWNEQLATTAQPLGQNAMADFPPVCVGCRGSHT